MPTKKALFALPLILAGCSNAASTEEPYAEHADEGFFSALLPKETLADRLVRGDTSLCAEAKVKANMLFTLRPTQIAPEYVPYLDRVNVRLESVRAVEFDQSVSRLQCEGVLWFGRWQHPVTYELTPSLDGEPGSILPSYTVSPNAKQAWVFQAAMISDRENPRPIPKPTPEPSEPMIITSVNIVPDVPPARIIKPADPATQAAVPDEPSTSPDLGNNP